MHGIWWFPLQHGLPRLLALHGKLLPSRFCLVLSSVSREGTPENADFTLSIKPRASGWILLLSWSPVLWEPTVLVPDLVGLSKTPLFESTVLSNAPLCFYGKSLFTADDIHLMFLLVVH
jgi:hypothetical protein